MEIILKFKDGREFINNTILKKYGKNFGKSIKDAMENNYGIEIDNESGEIGNFKDLHSIELIFDEDISNKRNINYK